MLEVTMEYFTTFIREPSAHFAMTVFGDWDVKVSDATPANCSYIKNVISSFAYNVIQIHPGHPDNQVEQEVEVVLVQEKGEAVKDKKGQMVQWTKVIILMLLQFYLMCHTSRIIC